MGRLTGTARRLRAHRSESGFTLVEMLVVMALSTVVIGIPVAFIAIATTQQNAASSRVAAAAQEEIGLEQLTRDLQQTVPSTTTTLTWSSSSATVAMTIPVPGTQGASTEPVAWNCTLSTAGTGSCTRSVSSGAAVAEIHNVVSISFAPVDGAGNPLGGSSAPYSATNPAYVKVTAKVLDVSLLDATGCATACAPTHAVSGVGTTTPLAGNPITLQAGVALLNNNTSG